MLSGQPNAEETVRSILRELGAHSVSLAHNRHLSATKCKEIGLKIMDLESDQKLQEKVLSLHHIYFHTLSSTPAFKIIENNNGMAFIMQAEQVVVAQQRRGQMGSVPPPSAVPPPQLPVDTPNPVPTPAPGGRAA